MSSSTTARRGCIIEAVGEGGLIVLGLLNETAGVFPPLKSAVGGTLAIVNLINVCITGDSSFYQGLTHKYRQEIKSNKEDWDKFAAKLTQDMENIAQCFDGYASNEIPSNLRANVEKFDV
jgi:hypothetical protein